MLGKTLNGQYEIIKFLGKGGFGETYIARDKFKPSNSQCVIKHLKPKNTEPDTLKAAKKLFDREAKILYQLGRHNQIPKLLAHFEEDGEFYLVEEFIDGNDLKKELESVKQFSEEQVVVLLRDVLETLKFVHEKDVIHRDIKPSNLIRRCQDGKIVLIDFGAVKEVATQETSSDGMTSFTVAIGTRGYMPNEQLGGKPRFSSDIYALGMTAIHALTGMCPPTPSKKLSNQLQEDSRTGEIIWRHYAQVNDRLAAILDKMVKSHYRDRYDRVEDVIKELEKLPYSSDTTNNTDFSTITTRKLPVLKLPKLKYILVSLAAIGVAIGGGLTITQFLSSYKSEQPSNPQQPSTAADLVKQGNELYNSGKYEEAIKAYDKALKSNPDKPEEIWKSRGAALTELPKYEEAVDSYDKALAIKPDDVDALNSQGILLRKLNKYENALATYDKALKIKPDDASTLNNKGVLLLYMGKLEEALTTIDKSLKINPDNANTWNQKGKALLKLKKYQDAVVAYDKAVSIQPNYPIAWFDRGDALLNLQRYQEAVYSYDEAIRNKHDYPEAWLGKGASLMQLKKYQEAVIAFDEAIKLKADYFLAWLNKGASLYYLKQYQEALKAVDESIKIQPNSPDAWFGKGKVLYELQQYKEAVAAYDKAIELKPDYQEAKDARKLAAEKQ